MAEDPYQVLGVPRNASEDDVRRAYRKLAKELHPDLNPANRASAEERFKKVSAAYEIVGDAEKRKQFDRGEIDASTASRGGVFTVHTPAATRRLAGQDKGGSPGRRRLQLRRHLLRPVRHRAAARARRAARSASRGRDVRYTPRGRLPGGGHGRASKRVTLARRRRARHRGSRRCRRMARRCA